MNDAYAPKYQYADIKTGIKISYVELGKMDERPIVFLHGATDSYLSFSQMAPKTAAFGYRVIVPELRGHGQSDKPLGSLYTIETHTADIHALLTMLNICDAHIVGHSLGSFVAQKLAAEHSELVSSITLIGSAETLTENPVLEWLLEGDEEFEGINHVSSLPDDFLIDWAASSNKDTIFIQKTFDHAKALPIEIWRSVFGGAASSCFADPSDITVPVQIIYGTDDIFFSKELQMELIAQLGSDSIHFVKKNGAGHNTHWEGNLGEEIAEDIVRFLKN